ncbi:MAG: dienelactone hydrolase [Betaproteobacteria bacterium]|nr:dienelactone hydrolase [Betaproteobacteria bacterium]
MKPSLDFLLRYLALSALALALAMLIADNAVALESTAWDKPGPLRVETREETWRDAMRDRDVPVKLYVPGGSDAGQKWPVILFSHGLGGSRAAGTMWAQHWASHGFIVVSMQHAGSDEGLWKSRPAADVETNLKSGMTLSNLGLRVGDVRYAIDEIERRAKSGDMLWRGADASRIGLAGHSFGAQTTLAVSGQKAPNLAGQSGLDARVVAAIAFSPNARNKQNLPRQFGDIRIPFFSITGTEDGSVLGDGTTWQDRTLPFEHMPEGGKFLLVLDGADHMVFGGLDLRRRTKTAIDVRVQGHIKASTLAFWRAQLSGGKEAAQGAAEMASEWLNKSFAKTLDAKDQFKSK